MSGPYFIYDLLECDCSKLYLCIQLRASLIACSLEQYPTAPPLTHNTNTKMNALAFLRQRWSTWTFSQGPRTSLSHLPVLSVWLPNPGHSFSSLPTLNRK